MVGMTGRPAVALAVLLALSACGARPTTVRLTLESGGGAAPASLILTIVVGGVQTNSPYAVPPGGGRPSLPAQALIIVPDAAVEVMVSASGLDDGGGALSASGSVESSPHAEVPLDLILSGPAPTDGGGRDFAAVDLAPPATPDLGPPIWNGLMSGTVQELASVWGASNSSVFVAGFGPTLLSGSAGMVWTSHPPPGNLDLFAVCGRGNALYAVGAHGTAFYSANADATWSTISTPGTPDLHGCAVSSDSKLHAVGAGGNALVSAGGAAAMSSQGTPGSANLYTVAAIGGDLFAVGVSGVILHNDGTGWKVEPSNVVSDLRGVWGLAPTDVWAVGDSGVLLHRGAVTWVPAQSGVANDLYALWGSSALDVYAVGGTGTVIHTTDGMTWQRENSGSGATLRSVWGSSAADVYLVGNNGTIRHRN